jgi:hypothetical protein
MSPRLAPDVVKTVADCPSCFPNNNATHDRKVCVCQKPERDIINCCQSQKKGCNYDKGLLCYMYINLVLHNPMPVGARSKACICGRSLAGIAGSNPAGGMDVSLL